MSQGNGRVGRAEEGEKVASDFNADSRNLRPHKMDEIPGLPANDVPMMSQRCPPMMLRAGWRTGALAHRRPQASIWQTGIVGAGAGLARWKLVNASDAMEMRSQRLIFGTSCECFHASSLPKTATRTKSVCCTSNRDSATGQRSLDRSLCHLTREGKGENLRKARGTE